MAQQNGKKNNTRKTTNKNVKKTKPRSSNKEFVLNKQLIAVILFAIIIFKKKANHNSENVSNDREGGAEEWKK